MARFDLNDYVDVAERIDQFYTEYPGGHITTQLVNQLGWNGKQTQFIVQAFLADEKGVLLATGLAEESFGNSGANQTSPLENAETSAIGRACANLNFSKTKSGNRQRASLQEMEKVERGTPVDGKGTGRAVASVSPDLRGLLLERFSTPEERRKYVAEAIGREVSGVSDLTEEEVTKCIDKLSKEKQ